MRMGTRISENFDIKHLPQSKADLSKETKKNSKKRYRTNFRSSLQRLFYKKGVLKNFATYLIAYHKKRHFEVAGSNLTKPVKTMTSE